MDEVYELMEEVNKRTKVLEEINRRRQDEVKAMEKMSERELLESNQWHYKRVKEMYLEAFEKLIKKDFPNLKPKTKELFEEFLPLQLDRKVKNMIEFLKSKNGTN